MKPLSFLPGLLAAGVLVACSSGTAGGDSGGPGTGGSGTPPGDASGGGSDEGGDAGAGGTGTAGVSLSIASAAISTSDFNTTDFFLDVSLTLKNTAAGGSLSTNPAFFSLETSQALVLGASSTATNLSECSATLSVASGGQDTCSVTFDVPMGQMPARVLYDDMRGDRATAPIPAADLPSVACSTYEGWSHPGDACALCIGHAGGLGGVADAGAPACDDAVTAYLSACEAAAQAAEPTCGAVDSLRDVNPAGIGACACEPLGDDAQCQTLFQAAVSCFVMACGTQCP